MKGKKRIKNQPLFHGEVKKPHTVWLTDEAWNKLKEQAKNERISASEYIERAIKGIS